MDNNDLSFSKTIVAYSYVIKNIKNNPTLAVDFMKQNKNIFNYNDEYLEKLKNSAEKNIEKTKNEKSI